MADQAIWFKLWCSALMDPALANLEVSDFGRWAKLGTLLKQQGTGGVVTLEAPASQLCAMFQVSDYKALITMFHRLPGVQISSVSDETNVNVSMRNWARYQGDLSTPRVRRFRQNETAKTRSRREVDKTRREVPPVVPRGDLAIVSAFDAFWTAYPHKVGKDAAAKAWAKRKCDGERVAIMAGLERTLPHLTRDGGKYMPNPATWLNQGRWKDEPKPMLLISPENAEAARGFLEAR